MHPNSSPSSSTPTFAGRYLTFRIGDEAYGVDVLVVQEIIRSTAITVVPQLPAHLRGVINLRGRIVPVVDLRRRFGLAPSPENARACIVVVQLRSAARGLVPIGFLVDVVEEVLTLAAADFSPPPALGCVAEVSFLRGLARVGGEVKTLLDIERVLTGEPLASDSRAAA